MKYVYTIGSIICVAVFGFFAVTSDAAAATSTLEFGPAPTQPESDIILAGTNGVKMNAIRFQADGEAFVVDELAFNIDYDIVDSLVNVTLKYPTESSSSTSAQTTVTGTSTEFTNLGLYVPQGSFVDLRVSVDIFSIASGTTSGAEGSVNLWTNGLFKATGQDSGEVDTDPTDSSGAVQNETDVVGNDMIIRDTELTISLVNLTSTTLVNGVNEISRFKVAADPEGSVGIYKLTWEFLAQDSTSTPTSTIELSDVELYDATSTSSPITASSTYVFDSSIEITLPTQLFVAANSEKEYYLEATVSGVESGESLKTRFPSPSTETITANAFNAAAAGHFIWSDLSAPGHSLSTLDWTNGKYIEGMPSSEQKLSS